MRKRPAQRSTGARSETKRGDTKMRPERQVCEDMKGVNYSLANHGQASVNKVTQQSITKI